VCVSCVVVRVTRILEGITDSSVKLSSLLLSTSAGAGPRRAVLMHLRCPRMPCLALRQGRRGSRYEYE
jgi:hypothetical protein